MNRREALKIMTAASALTLVGAKKTPMTRIPPVFLAHGAPPLLDEPGWVAELGAWAKALPRPTSVLMISAHWDERPATLGATRPVPLIYDFYGFPERFYRLRYPSPGAPDLGLRVRAALDASRIPHTDAPERGLDHGAYVPLMCMYPQADVPVLQLSLPGLEPQTLFALGKALAPLRDEGVLIIGSGFLTHNLRAGFLPSTPPWAADFDAWAEKTLTSWNVDALLDYRAKAPGVVQALPTVEHFVPVIVAAGAADGQPKVSYPITGFWYGSFTRRSVQFG